MSSSFKARGGGFVVAQLVLMTLVMVAGPWLAGTGRHGWLGGALILAGAFFGIGGSLALGRNRTAYPEPKAEGELVRHGVYAWVRHPLYTSLLLLGLGWSAVWGSWPALLATVALGVQLRQKSRVEERRLMELFPDYAEYREEVSAFLPWPRFGRPKS